MAKAQQSRSKSAYRAFIGYTAKVIEYYLGQQVESEEALSGLLEEMENDILPTQEEMFDSVLFSRTRDIDLWKDRFDERRTYALDKVREFFEDKLAETKDEEEDFLSKQAREFGAPLDVYIEFLKTGIAHERSSQARDRERRTGYVSLQDVLNVYRKILAFVTNVRFDGHYYWVSINDSGGRRAARRREKRRARKTKTARF